jgi:predicted acylesterase/phospholipase RssA
MEVKSMITTERFLPGRGGKIFKVTTPRKRFVHLVTTFQIPSRSIVDLSSTCDAESTRRHTDSTGHLRYPSIHPSGPTDFKGTSVGIAHCPRILALDGGGVRGLSSLLILREIMEEIERKSGAEKTPLPCEYFDLIGGTSTGGLIAIMLGRLRMVRSRNGVANKSIEECIAKYIELAETVFNIDNVIAGTIPTGDDRCRFDASILEGVIKKLVKEKLGDENATMAPAHAEGPFCPTYVVAMSASNADGPPTLFRSYRCDGFNANKCTIWQAARATSAAPSFFRRMFVDVPTPGGWFIDGGVRFNNPSELALAEARRFWMPVKRFCLVSVGTGRQKNVEFMNTKDSNSPAGKMGSTSKFSISGVLSKIPGAQRARKVKNAPSGLAELKKIAAACVEMSASSEPVHDTMVGTANSSDPDIRQGLRYHRFNVERGMDSIGLQEWKTTVRMGELTAQYLADEEGRQKRNACVQDLLKPSVVECNLPCIPR